MPQPPLSDDLAIEAAEAKRLHGSDSAAAAALGLPRNTFRNHLAVAARRGFYGREPVMPGYEVARVSSTVEDGRVVREWVQQRPAADGPFNLPEGHRIKGVSALLDESGNVRQQWVKTREDDPTPERAAEILRAAFSDIEPHRTATPAPHAVAEDLLTLFPAGDWHVGLYVWGKEGGENWDLAIAEKTIGAAIDELVARSPASKQGVILVGGDLLHADNFDNRTARSGHSLDVDGRYPKVLIAAARLIVRYTDRALERNENVIVRVLRGNHDEISAVAVAYFLMAWYRNEPRVTVDVDPSLFWWHRFGSVLLGATHGHTVKIAQMPMIMAHRRAEDWGATKFRYIHGFHLHHSSKIATEGQGCISEIHQAPVPQDAWHYGSGFLSGRSIQSISYHASYGEISRARVAIIDG